MKKEELKAKLDTWLGIVSEERHSSVEYTELWYLSPTGITLFAVELWNEEFSWKVGGHTGALLEDWKTLLAFNR